MCGILQKRAVPKAESRMSLTSETATRITEMLIEQCNDLKQKQ